MAVVAHHAAGFDDDQIEPDRQAREGGAGTGPIEERKGRRVDPRSFRVIDGLFGQAEVASRSPADLNEDERPRGARIDGDEVDLRPADPELACQDLPALGRKTLGNKGLCRIAELLRRRSHGAIVAMAAWPRLIRRSSRAHPA